ncbi:MAG: DNA polymerase III subunit chi [Gammaproteobacteria bacterium]|nr:DNA polymerase III subunit chi [Gammaproteobacteria bacterium]MCW8992100.1 DNA polymerase III subunit chi [Gammaproteobacteria bacterium]
MTQVDFYILDDPAADARQRFACRLAEKAWQQGHQVYIHTGDPVLSARLDDLLWTFRQGSFVPHGLDDDPASDEVAIHIGHGEEPRHHDEVLINLGQDLPLFFSRFRRVAEVVDNNEENRRAGRERFRFYRDRGYALQSHSIKHG